MDTQGYHHDTSIFIDLVQNDLNEGKKKRITQNPIYLKV